MGEDFVFLLVLYLLIGAGLGAHDVYAMEAHYASERGRDPDAPAIFDVIAMAYCWGIDWPLILFVKHVLKRGVRCHRCGKIL